LLWLFFVLVLSIAVLVLVIDAMRMLARAFRTVRRGAWHLGIKCH
jgi:hypothetical protein